MSEDEQIGTVEFTRDDMEAIASLPLQNLKPLLSAEQFAALQKFVHVNQACTSTSGAAQ